MAPSLQQILEDFYYEQELLEWAAQNYMVDHPLVKNILQEIASLNRILACEVYDFPENAISGVGHENFDEAQPYIWDPPHINNDHPLIPL